MAQRKTLRVAILANTLPAALKVYRELEAVPGVQLYILLCRTPDEAPQRFLFRHAARLVMRRGGFKSLRLMLARKVFIIQKPLDHPQSLKILSRLKLDVGLHKVGVIYREPTIRAFRLGILNPHIGILPRYRGRAVMEWSLLEGRPTGVTLFFIDAGIDTGRRIVFSEEVDISNCRSVQEAKNYLFNLDARFFRRAIEMLCQDESSYQLNDGSGRRYYVMSKLFQGVAEELIKPDR